MRIMVVGSGGREAALIWAILKSLLPIEKIFFVPGNASPFDKKVERVLMTLDNIWGLADFAFKNRIDMVVVGPEGPLVAGLADVLKAAGILCVGPGKKGALLEGSKSYCMKTLARHGVLFGDFEVFSHSSAAKDYVRDYGVPIVLKADGLCGGKGVEIARTIEDADAFIDKAMEDRVFGEAGEKVVCQEYFGGPGCREFSYIGLFDNKSWIPMAMSEDYKQEFDGDQGENTGSMGSCSAEGLFGPIDTTNIEYDIAKPTFRAMGAEGIDYWGWIYIGGVLTPTGPKLFEINCRLGDSETQAILPRLKSDLLELLIACAKGELSGKKAVWSPRATNCVVMAGDEYPDNSLRGEPIKGLKLVEGMEDIIVTHAGTAIHAGRLVAHGGRILNITGLGDTLEQAVARSYKAVNILAPHNPRLRFRTDIGMRTLQSASST